MPILAVKCGKGSVIEVNGIQRFCRKAGHVFFDVPAPSVNVIRSWTTKHEFDLNSNGMEAVAIPGVGIVEFQAEKDSHSKSAYSVSVRGCIAIDWGGIVEIEVSASVLLHENLCTPVKLNETEMRFRGSAATASVYRDNGIRLAITPKGRGEQMYFGICGGFNAKLGKLDVGSKSLLTVAVNDMDMHGKPIGRLIVVNDNAEAVLELSGDIVEIADGCVDKIDKIDAVSGLERRTRYDHRNVAFALLRDDIGHFTEKERKPVKQTEITAELIMRIKYSQFNEARKLLSAELSEALDDETIKAFFGSFERVVFKPCPIIGESGDSELVSTIVAGLIDEEPSVGSVVRPRQLAVSLQGGLITDIEALEEE